MQERRTGRYAIYHSGHRLGTLGQQGQGKDVGKRVSKSGPTHYTQLQSYPNIRHTPETSFTVFDTHTHRAIYL